MTANTTRALSEQTLSRRTMLKGSAALAGMGALGALPKLARAETPKKGGNLRVAILGGGSADTLDAHNMVTQPDSHRVMALYEGLTQLNSDGKLTYVLAESMEPNATGTEWTIRLKKGVEFHNGKTMTAADVAATFRRIGNPDAPMAQAAALKPLDLGNLKAVDDQTLIVPMKRPYAAFQECISAYYYFGIVPADYDPKNPVGTGAFKYKSFAPGQESVFDRFDNYRGEQAHLDQLTIISSFGADTAAFNALQGGEIDIFAYAPLALVKQVGEGGAIKPLVSKPGQWTPFTMRVDQAPFDNPDVRMAFRLLVDRQQLIDISLSGYGKVGNDIYSPWDPAYDASLKRERDIDQAKFLLKKAGQENLTVELVTCDFAAGVVQAAQVMAQQAKDAGVTVNVRQVTSEIFYGDQYLKWTFAQDYWGYSPYLSQVAQGSLPDSPYNETHWTNEEFNKLHEQAQATVDEAKRTEILHAMQKLEFEQGGYLIAAYNQNVDLMGSYVEGLNPAATGLSMGNSDFKAIWLA